MTKEERAEQQNITMYPRQWGTVRQLAANAHDGNRSSALRAIVDQWSAFEPVMYALAMNHITNDEAAERMIQIRYLGAREMP